MKISYRIILINFAIVALILGGSGAAFYSIMFNVLTSQQSKHLLKSSNDFLFFLQQTVQDADESFNSIVVKNSIKNFHQIDVKALKLDFVFNAVNDSLVFPNQIAWNKDHVNYSGRVISLSEFLFDNPFLIIKKFSTPTNSYYYGFILSKRTITNISKRIDAELAIFIDDNFAEFSNEELNQQYFYTLNKANNHLKHRGNFDIYSESAENTYFIATMYRIKDYSPVGKNIAVVVFSTSDETEKLKNGITDILIILGISSIALSMILSLLFTSKIRKQIACLNDATENIKSGKFDNRLSIQSNDELGDLALAYNKMIDELEKREKSKQEYAEFITLINQNPSLRHISDAALNKIINTSGLNVGAIYLIDEGEISFVTSYGFIREQQEVNPNIDLYNVVVQKGETIEIKFDENYPRIFTGIFNLDIKYLLILPIIYNNKVIAILELGSVNVPKPEVKEYLEKIKEQLAVGITNATALYQLENLVVELKNLNEDYQKQNLQVKQQNEKLIELHKELKEKAAELEVQKKRAEESTVLKSQFLALMSHELKTPLNSILGLSELVIADGAMNEKNKERLSVVIKSGKRLMNLINDILMYSKIEAGKIDIKNESFSLQEMLNEITASFTSIASERKIELLTENHFPERTIINTDRTKIFQTLINLVDNALKFTEKGFVKIVVKRAENSKIEFRIIDSGKGITDSEKEIIFEEFRQVDSSNSRRFGGSGLGLSICKKFVELLNGKISVESNSGFGSTFIVEIPVIISEITGSSISEIMNKDELEIDLNAKTKYKIKSITFDEDILIVDDDPDSLFTLKEILQKDAYKVVLAKNGRECLEVLDSIKPKLILLDIMMPELDGFQTIKLIKKRKELSDVPILAVSAKAMLDDQRVIFKYGFDGFVPKPINANELLEKVEIIMKKKNSL